MNNEKPPRLTAFYLAYLKNHNSRCFVDLTARYYNEGTLQRLTNSSNAETRRAAVTALGLLGTYHSNGVLGRKLKDADRNVCLLAESSLKSVWTREGNTEQRQGLYAVMRAISDRDFSEAVRLANNLLAVYPFLVETRNQRAIALFALKSFDEAIADCEIVLDLNPYHFGAALGMGHAYLQLHNKEQAVGYFQQALDINPNLESIRRHLQQLKSSGK